MSSSTATITRFFGAMAAKASAPLPTNAKQQWAERAGILLQIATSDGLIGQGEASPLPGYSPDTLEDCEAILVDQCRANLDEVLALTEPSAIFAVVRERIPAAFPAARFALETALLDLIAQRRNEPLHRLFRRDSTTEIPLSALLPTSAIQDVVPMALGLFERGIRSFKLKIGFLERWEEEQRLLCELRSRLGNKVRLRLDANQAFDSTNVGERLRALAVFQPEYVEEPCPPDVLCDLDELSTSIALDETLQQANPRVSAWLNQHPGSVLVLKPMVLGGFSACFRWAEVARRQQLGVVVSHAFDGPIALLAAAQLALSLECAQSAAGLMPHAGLAVWPNVDLVGIESAAIRSTSRAGLGAAPLPIGEPR